MAVESELMPNADRDDKSGKYTQTYPPEAFTDAIRDADGFAGTQDVADAVGCSYELAYKRLRALTDAGDVKSRKVANARVWSVSVSGDAPEPGDVSGGGGETPQPPDQSESRSAAAHGDQSEPVGGAIDDAIAALDAPDGRRDAVRACVEYLREHGSAQKSDFVDDVYPDHTSGFASPGGWWNKIGKEYLSAVADDVAAVSAPATEGSHTWRFDRSSPGGGRE